MIKLLKNRPFSGKNAAGIFKTLEAIRDYRMIHRKRRELLSLGEADLEGAAPVEESVRTVGRDRLNILLQGYSSCDLHKSGSIPCGITLFETLFGKVKSEKIH